jgi:predicted acyl esterase
MSLGAVRNLSPDFVRDVLPKLPPPPQPNAPFNRSHVAENMKRMRYFKDHALKTYWPELIESVSIQNTKISMRDGVQVDLRVYKPNKDVPVAGSRQVVYSYVHNLVP